MPDLRAVAEEINRLHKDRPGTHALARDYRYVGLVGQAAAARLLGVTTDLSVHGGDRGIDMVVKAIGRCYTVDAKTSRAPHLGMLVEIAKARADIFMFMGYPDLDCWGWNWRAVIVRAPVVDKGHGVPSYEVPNGWLRRIDELLRRIEP